MKKAQPDQAALIRSARKILGVTTEELAAKLGKSLSAVRSWLLPKGNQARRNMPQSARLLLAILLAEKRKRKR